MRLAAVSVIFGRKKDARLVPLSSKGHQHTEGLNQMPLPSKS